MATALPQKLDIPVTALVAETANALRTSEVLRLQPLASAPGAYECCRQSGEVVGKVTGLQAKLRGHSGPQATVRSLKRDATGNVCHMLLRVILSSTGPGAPASPAPAAAQPVNDPPEYVVDDDGFQLRRAQLEHLVCNTAIRDALGDARLQALLLKIDSGGPKREQLLEEALHGPAFAAFAEQVLALLDEGLGSAA